MNWLRKLFPPVPPNERALTKGGLRIPSASYHYADDHPDWTMEDQQHLVDTLRSIIHEAEQQSEEPK